MKSEPNRTKFGAWFVDENGNMENDKEGFCITSDRLQESDWWAFLLSDSTVNFNDFLPAYFHACKIAKIEKVEILMQIT